MSIDTSKLIEIGKEYEGEKVADALFAAASEITRLTERNAELQAECELLAEDNDRAQQVITAHWHNLERERNRADKAEATIKRVLNYGDLPEAARYELQQALNAPETA